MAYPDYSNNFDTKWKDSRSNPKYDVDDPMFCSPESVISGLVSGFCERQAVVNSSFVTGTTASPVTSDWFAATSAGRDAIVDSCVQHVISHDLKPSDVGAESYKGPVDGSFHAVDHASVQDGGVTKITTYMTHMDGLIDSLVQTGEYKTDITGATAYTTFDQLASSASAAVAGTASACNLAVSGGTAYSSEFMPAFPKAWALERKWMLEQLRYTGENTVAAPVDNVPNGGISGYGDVNGLEPDIITQDIINNGTPFDPGDDWSDHNYIGTYNEKQANDTFNTVSPMTLFTNPAPGAGGTMSGFAQNVTLTSDGSSVVIPAWNISYMRPYDYYGDDVVSALYTREFQASAGLQLTSALDVITSSPITGKVTVSIYVAMPTGGGSPVDNEFTSAYICPSTSRYGEMTTYYAQDGDVFIGPSSIVNNGVTKTIDYSYLTIIAQTGVHMSIADGSFRAAIVEAGASIDMTGPNSFIHSCCVITGGTFTCMYPNGTVNAGGVALPVSSDTISAFSSDFSLNMYDDYAKLESAYCLNTVKDFTQVELDAIQGICVLEGGTATITSKSFGDVTGDGLPGRTGMIRVSSGGTAILYGDTSTPTMTTGGVTYNRYPAADKWDSGYIAWRNGVTTRYTNRYDWRDVSVDDSVYTFDGADFDSAGTVTAVYKPPMYHAAKCFVLPGGTLLVHGGPFATFGVASLCVESGGSCVFYDNCMTGDTYIASGGYLEIHSDTRIGNYSRYNDACTIQQGATVSVTGATCAMDTFKARVRNAAQPSTDGFPNVYVRRFETFGLKSTDGHNTPLTYGWNVVEVNFGVLGSTAASMYSCNLADYSAKPVPEILFHGLDNYDWYYGTSDSDVVDGFRIAAIKVSGSTVTDHYKEFRLRQNKT